MRYRMYVDESGDQGMSNLVSLQKQGNRYLALCGVIFEFGSSYNKFAFELEELKANFFEYHADDPIILHRRDILDKRGVFKRLLDKDVNNSFDNQILDLMSKTEFTVITIVIDKLELLKRYTNPWHPYHSALTMLMQRYSPYLAKNHSKGDIWVESRGKREDRLLRETYAEVFQNGCMFNTSSLYKQTLTSKNLKNHTQKQKHCRTSISGFDCS